MTTEELLRPRFKVIADYPNSGFKVGQILACDKLSAGMWYHQFTEEEPIHIDGDATNFFPANFKKLKWWEERRIDELPQYIIGKHGGDDFYVKVDEWIARYYGLSPATTVLGITYYAEYSTPITEQEYNDKQKLS